MNKKSTKRALLCSLLSLVVCVSMLVGSTFAWFTDSVTSAQNTIQSGNLDVELYYQVEGQTDWTKVTPSTNVFKAGALWEPGYTEVIKLKVVNEGSLALKYQLGVNIVNEVGSTNVNGTDFKLSDFIKYGIVDGAQDYTRDQAIAAVDATASLLKAAYNSDVTSLPAKNDTDTDEKVVTMVVYMPTTVGNDANHKKDAAVPTINLGINLFATQDTVEADSFNEWYDEFAELPEMGSAVIPDNASEPTYIQSNEDGNVVVSVPAGASAGIYTLEVKNRNVTSDAQGNATAAYDIELLKDGQPVPAGAYTVHINVGKGLNITGVTHNSEAITNYSYDIATGVITFTTDSFSPFTVTYYDGKVTEETTAEELAALLARGGNVTLMADLALTEMLVVPEGVEVVLDINGNDITVPETTERHLYALNNKGTLTLKDSVGTGTVSARGIYNGYNGVSTDQTVAGAKMIVESGNYVGLDSDGGAPIFNCAELVINGGKFSGGAAAVNTRKMGVTTINGGVFVGTSINNYCIQNNGGQVTVNNASVIGGFGAVGCYGGNTIINDGSYLPTGGKGKTCHVIYVSDASTTVVINGGTFKMDYPESAVPDSGSAVASYYKGNLTINGGTFISHFDNVSPVELSAGATIKGGTFLVHSGAASNHSYVTNFLDSNYDLVDGKVVCKYGAKIGDQYYDTFAEALKSVKDGETIIITADITDTTVKFPAALKDVIITAADGVVVKNTSFNSADGNTVNYDGLTFDGIVFDNSNLIFTGWRNSIEIYKDLAVKNCVFKNIVRAENHAAVHLNLNQIKPLENFTFTGNVVDGVTGSSNSAIYCTGMTGNIVIENNVINNVAFRPFVIHVTNDDAKTDKFTVKGNTFSGSAAGRLQALGTNTAGTDTVELVVTENIFKGITNAQQICYYNFNNETTTTEFAKNYYDLDIAKSPSLIYYNKAASSVDDLVAMGIYPIYSELNTDGTINTDSLVKAPK